MDRQKVTGVIFLAILLVVLGQANKKVGLSVAGLIFAGTLIYQAKRVNEKFKDKKETPTLLDFIGLEG